MLSKIAIRILFLPAFCALLISSSVQAGYLIVKNSSCRSESCVEPILLDDPHRDELYQILLDYTWPTAKKFSLELTEEEDLSEALKTRSLNAHYRYIWVPDTLQDLHCAVTLLEQRGVRALLVDDSKPLIQEYKISSGGFTPDTNEKFKASLKNPSANPADEIEQYFSKFNQLGKDPYFVCNEGLARALIKQVSSAFNQTDGSTQDHAGLDDLKEVLNQRNGVILKKFLGDLTHTFNQLAKFYGFGPRDSLLVFQEPNSILERVIELEIESNQRNEALLFRGTNGVGTLDGVLAIDSPFFNRPKKGATRDCSLSYGTTLLAGLFRESSAHSFSGTACAMGYIGSTRIQFGYAVRIKKNDPWVKELFEIPRLGLIGRLFASGEFFHPRSKVGILGASPDAQVCGVFPYDPVNKVKNLSRLNQLVTLDTPENLSKRINQYLADHAVLITQGGGVLSEEAARSILSAQQSIARRKLIASPGDVQEVIEKVLNCKKLLNCDCEKILNAAAGELVKVKGSDLATVGSIVRLLDHPDQKIRRLSVDVLGVISAEDRSIHKKIAERLEDESVEVFEASVEVLKSLPLPFDEDTSHIIARNLGLHSPSPKKKVINIFERREEPIHLAREIQVVLAKDLSRWENVALLKKMEGIDPTALTILVEALRNSSTNLRIEAIGVLSKKVLSDEIQNMVLGLLYDQEVKIRVSAIQFFRERISQLTPDVLIQLARSMRDKNSFVRFSVSVLFADEGVPRYPQVDQELLDVLKSDDLEIREDVLKVLNNMGLWHHS